MMNRKGCLVIATGAIIAWIAVYLIFMTAIGLFAWA